MVGIGIYLPYTLNLSFGTTPIRLYGLIGVTTAGASFALSTTLRTQGRVGANALARFFPDDATTAIVDPLGLRGFTLDRFDLAGAITPDAGGHAVVAMTVTASARYAPLGDGVRFDAALVIDANAVRLIRIALVLATPLTLTSILARLIDDAGDWARPVTDQFAFTDGRLYWLEAPAGRGDDYVFTADGVPYRPGYHIDGGFRLFGRYAFTAGLARSPDGTVAVRASAPLFDVFDFVRLERIDLSMTKGGRSSRIALAIGTIHLFGTAVGAASADYDTTTRRFTGEVTADAGIAALTIGYAWDQDRGLTITGLDGLPTLPEPVGMDRLASLMAALNAGGGGCAALVESWFKAVAVTLTPGLQQGKSPSKVGDSMRLPLQIAYAMKIGSMTLPIDPPPIRVNWGVAIPGSIGDLPTVILESIADNIGDLLTAMLRDPATYAALAIEIGKRVGAKAAARLACRALENFGKDVAQRVLDEIGEKAGEAIGDMAELASVAISVATAGIALAMNALEEIWDAIKKLFSDDKEGEAADLLDPITGQVEAVIASVQAKVADVESRLHIASVTTVLDAQSTVGLMVVVPNTPNTAIGDGLNLICDIRLLAGNPGEDGTTIPLPGPPLSLPVAVPLAQLVDRDYRMNASVQYRLTGAVFMTAQVDATLGQYRDALDDFDADAARRLRDRIDEARSYFAALNANGINGNRVFATSDVPPVMTVGRSIIGFNSRVAA